MAPDQPPPMSIQGQIAMAGMRLSVGDVNGAEALCRSALAAAPGTPEAHLMLGIVLATRGDTKAGFEEFNRALLARPGFAPAMAQKARLLDAIGRRREAVELAEAAGARAEDAYSLDTAGVVLTRAGRHEKAAALYARAVKAGDAPGYFYNYGAALQFLGRFDEARTAYRECIKRAPMHAKAWAGLVQITKQTKDANEIETLTKIAMLAGQEKDAETLHSIGHAIAKAHEDVGEPVQAMEWLARAKAPMKAATASAKKSGGDPFAAAMRSLALPPAKGFAGVRPIFVTGMPRTGTTLVDRILTSHSQVSSAGELDDFPMALRRATGSRAPGLIAEAMIGAASKADAEAIGRDYIAGARGRQSLRERFVDKLPLNAFLAPLILRALPDARVICLRRHPADAVLSNYRQEFSGATEDLYYTLDLEETARYYVSFDRMASRFAAALPPERYTEARYEDIVSDIGCEARRLLDFCGLAFEEACLNFQDNAAPVATASAAQVRQPLYASSIGRWKKYRPAIDPALRILVESGVMKAEEMA